MIRIIIRDKKKALLIVLLLLFAVGLLLTFTLTRADKTNKKSSTSPQNSTKTASGTGDGTAQTNTENKTVTGSTGTKQSAGGTKPTATTTAPKTTTPTGAPAASNPIPTVPGTNTPPPTPTPTGRVCGTAGYNGNVGALTEFSTKYPAYWRSDYLFADMWGAPAGVFENFKLTGANYAFVHSDTMKMRNFYISPGGGYYVVNTDGRDTGAGSTIENGTILGVGATDDSHIKGITAWVDNLTIRDMDISGTHDGITVGANNILIENTCIHDLDGTPPNAHNDGIEIYGGSNITIRNVEIDNPNNQTSAINITNDGGPINNVLIENVKLSGGGYTIYVRGDGAGGSAPVTNIRFRNVTITDPGYWGVISYQSAPGAIVEWDVKDANGNPIPLN